MTTVIISNTSILKADVDLTGFILKDERAKKQVEQLMKNLVAENMAMEISAEDMEGFA